MVWELLPKGHPCLSRSALVCKDVPWTWVVLVWVVDVVWLCWRRSVPKLCDQVGQLVSGLLLC